MLQKCSRREVSNTQKLKSIKILYSIFSVCLMLFGAWLAIRPEMADGTFILLLGIVLILFGILRIFGYFAKDQLQLAFQFDFAMGIISCLLGVAAVIQTMMSAAGTGQMIDGVAVGGVDQVLNAASSGKPGQMMVLLSLGIGIFLLADALFTVQKAIDARRIGVHRWWLILVLALSVAACGAVSFVRIFLGVKVIRILIGWNLVIDGLMNLYVVQNTVNTIRRNNKWEV